MATTVDRSTGRPVAVIGPASRGEFAIIATAPGSWTGAPGCLPVSHL